MEKTSDAATAVRAGKCMARKVGTAARGVNADDGDPSTARVGREQALPPPFDLQSQRVGLFGGRFKLEVHSVPHEGTSDVSLRADEKPLTAAREFDHPTGVDFIPTHLRCG